MFGCTVQLTQEESARNEIEAKLLATSNTLKEAQSAFDTERTQKDQELAQLKDEVCYKWTPRIYIYPSILTHLTRVISLFIK